jgi:hypothetical protein
MMSPNFFNDPYSKHNKRMTEKEIAIENFFIKLRAKITLKKHFPKIK